MSREVAGCVVDRLACCAACALLSLWLSVPAAASPSASAPSASAPSASLSVMPWHEPPWIGVVVPGREVVVVAEASGRLLDAAPVGAAVTAGSLLARVEAMEGDAALDSLQAAVRAAEADLERARVEQARAADIDRRYRTAPEVLSQDALAAAAHDLLAAAAAVDAAGARAAQAHAAAAVQASRSRRSRIEAPFAGRVAERRVDPGSYLAVGDEILRVVDDARRVRFAVPPSAALELAVGDVVAVRLAAESVAVPARAHAAAAPELLARIDSVAPEVDDLSGLVFVEAVPFEAVSVEAVSVEEVPVEEVPVEETAELSDPARWRRLPVGSVVDVRPAEDGSVDAAEAAR